MQRAAGRYVEGGVSQDQRQSRIISDSCSAPTGITCVTLTPLHCACDPDALGGCDAMADCSV